MSTEWISYTGRVVILFFSNLFGTKNQRIKNERESNLILLASLSIGWNPTDLYSPGLSFVTEKVSSSPPNGLVMLYGPPVKGLASH